MLGGSFTEDQISLTDPSKDGSFIELSAMIVEAEVKEAAGWVIETQTCFNNTILFLLLTKISGYS